MSSSHLITSALAFSSSPPHLPSRISHPPFARLGEDSGLYFLLIPSPSVLLPSGVDLVYWFFFFTLLNSRFFFLKKRVVLLDLQLEPRIHTSSNFCWFVLVIYLGFFRSGIHLPWFDWAGYLFFEDWCFQFFLRASDD